MFVTCQNTFFLVGEQENALDLNTMGGSKDSGTS